MAAASVLVTYTIAYTFKIFRPGPNSWAHCNPRSLYGERPLLLIQDFVYYIFQSTLPLRGATQGLVYFSDHGEISIHAPLVGSDQQEACSRKSATDFNPRSPCGERHYWVTHYVNGLPISIHAPLAGSDMTEIFMAWSK